VANIHLLLQRVVSVMRNCSLRVKYIIYLAVHSGQKVGTQWEISQTICLLTSFVYQAKYV